MCSVQPRASISFGAAENIFIKVVMSQAQGDQHGDYTIPQRVPIRHDRSNKAITRCS
jgi:hypothetical protein